MSNCVECSDECKKVVTEFKKMNQLRNKILKKRDKEKLVIMVF